MRRCGKIIALFALLAGLAPCANAEQIKNSDNQEQPKSFYATSDIGLGDHNSWSVGLRYKKYAISYARIYDLENHFTPINQDLNNEYVAIGTIGSTRSFGFDFKFYPVEYNVSSNWGVVQFTPFVGSGLYLREEAYVAESKKLGVGYKTDDVWWTPRVAETIGLSVQLRNFSAEVGYHTLRGTTLGVGLGF